MPHRTNFDMSVLQFRAEAFNYLQSHAVVADITTLGAQNFLYSTRAHMPRVLQFAPRIIF
jgi:hypothetical protein